VVLALRAIVIRSHWYDVKFQICYMIIVNNKGHIQVVVSDAIANKVTVV